jgi:hypothetical protein
MSPLQALGWGCAGSFAVEVVLFCQAVRHSRDNHVSSLYRTKAFMVGRILLVAVAGTLAAAWGITQAMQGVAIGAGAPQLVLALYRLRPQAADGSGSDSERSD